MNFLPIITGATASGKSALAIALAQAINGVIVNADSMQIYDAAPILTAQPNEAELATAEHQLYGVLNAADGCNVARWCALCAEAIEGIVARGKTPIIVGGTGLYITSLIYGLSAVPEIDTEIRQQVRRLDAAILYEALKAEDPAMADTLRPEDTQRLSRALEVIRSTGKSLLYWYQQPPILPAGTRQFRVFHCSVARHLLYERINARYDMMLAGGGLQEAERLHQRNLGDDTPLCRAVGIRDLLAYYHGTSTLEDAIIQAKASSRHYAKRQITWATHQYVEVTILDMQQDTALLVEAVAE